MALILNRSLYVTDIQDAAVDTFNQDILTFSAVNKDPITLYINSHGGDPDCVFYMISMMKASGCKFRTIGLNYAQSCGATLLASGDERLALKDCKILIHHIKFGTLEKNNVTSEKLKELTEELEVSKKQQTRALKEWTGQPFEKIWKDQQTDFKLTAQQAKKYGLIDKVISRLPRVNP